MILKTVLDLKIGEVGFIKNFRDADCACKLLTMGLLPKAKIKLIRLSPLGHSMYLKINHQYVAVRMSEAAMIQLEEN